MANLLRAAGGRAGLAGEQADGQEHIRAGSRKEEAAGDFPFSHPLQVLPLWQLQDCATMAPSLVQRW